MLKTMIRELRIAIICTMTLAAFCCAAYPVLVYGIAQGLVPEKANGSLVTTGRDIVGSRLLGQPFAGREYFHPRPSAAGAGYNGASSGGSNLGPLSKKLADVVEKRVAAYREENGLLTAVRIPADAVTASASGLDPHISVGNALLQVLRVARAREMSEEALKATVMANTEGRDLLVLGEPRVNVLKLNLDLDRRGLRD
jgi:K+-transporting ATPase ATPase C chain